MLLVATDIFGAQPELIEQLEQLDMGYQVVQPYPEMPKRFNDEGEAYAAFTELGGLNSYRTKLQQQLKLQRHAVQLLGFSAGAAAAWCCAAERGHNLRSVLAFYGGQIRDYTQLQPQVETRLVFCQVERHFSMPQLLANLAPRANLKVDTVEWSHGFCNPLSSGFNAIAADWCWQQVRGWIQQPESL